MLKIAAANSVHAILRGLWFPGDVMLLDQPVLTGVMGPWNSDEIGSPCHFDGKSRYGRLDPKFVFKRKDVR